METVSKTIITVETTVNAPLEKVWEFWTDPKHITIGATHQMTGMHLLPKMI